MVLVPAESSVVAVDGLLTVSAAREMRESIDRLAKPLRAVLLTQSHPDQYAGLVEIVAGLDVPIFAPQGVIDTIAADDAVKDQIIEPMFGEEWPAKRIFPNAPVRDGESVSFDCYLADGFYAEWLVNIEKLRARFPDDAVFYIGHGGPVGREMWDWQRGYLELFVEAVSAADWSEPDQAKASVVDRMGGKRAVHGRHRDEVDRVAEQIHAAGWSAVAIVGDVNVPDQSDAVADQTLAALGGLADPDRERRGRQPLSNDARLRSEQGSARQRDGLAGKGARRKRRDGEHRQPRRRRQHRSDQLSHTNAGGELCRLKRWGIKGRLPRRSASGRCASQRACTGFASTALTSLRSRAGESINRPAAWMCVVEGDQTADGQADRRRDERDPERERVATLPDHVEPLVELDAWLADYRALWTTHLDRLEEHLDRRRPK